MQKKPSQWWGIIGALLGTIIYTVFIQPKYDPAVRQKEELNRNIQRIVANMEQSRKEAAADLLAVLRPTVYTAGDYQYTILKDGTAELASYTGKEKILEIPDVIDGYPLTGIGRKCFSGNETLLRVTVPESVTSIGTQAFDSCTALQSVYLPDSVEDMSTFVFSHCTSLTAVRLPAGLTDISMGMFQYCESLQNISLPSSVDHIDWMAFLCCSRLSGITIYPRLCFRRMQVAVPCLHSGRRDRHRRRRFRSLRQPEVAQASGSD